MFLFLVPDSAITMRNISNTLGDMSKINDVAKLALTAMAAF